MINDRSGNHHIKLETTRWP